MYTALNDKGKIVHAADVKNNQKGGPAYDSEHFKCPGCGNEVYVRGGSIYVKAHFAHRIFTSCNGGDGESLKHKEAKLFIKTWLEQSGYNAEIEKVLPKAGKQRADIYVSMQGKKVVLEIQRSFLDEQQFYKRQLLYEKAGYTVIWIGVREENQEVYRKRLSVLDSICFRLFPFMHAFSYNSACRKLQIETAHTQLQGGVFLFQRTLISDTQNPYDCFFSEEVPALQEKISMRIEQEWKKKAAAKRGYPRKNITQAENEVLPYYLNHRLNLNYFPALCHIPVCGFSGIRTSVEVWQSWIIIHYVQKPGEKISLTPLTKAFENQRSFTFLPLAEHRRNLIRRGILNYLLVLAEFGALRRVYPGIFEVIKPLTVKKPLEQLFADDEYVRGKWKLLFRV
ncbi:competence protein CoiA [Alkalicoccus halolimnae]|uniref:Competence protein CoiA family protein n=1 Tax=Alkalicoccus halolimnae TaxID=1667239 RepID=A0AAJ8LPL7_9BACI|nr:competence protein CoiA family protein [Alkalicoccus halolimnae]